MASEPVQNTPGAWHSSDMNKVKKFLCYGIEDSSYHIGGEQELKQENVPALCKLLENGQGEAVVKEIVAFGAENKSVKPAAVVFALAVCARVATDLKTKQAAYKALPQVCQSPVELFHFVNFAEKLSGKTTGWGRAQRKAINDWYNGRDPNQLKVDVTRYRQRSGWSHIDLLRLAHVKPSKDITSLILKYVIKGIEESKKQFTQDGNDEKLAATVAYLEAVEAVKHSKDEQEAARLVEQHKLSREHIPTGLTNSKEVWRTLMRQLSLSVLLPYVPRLASLGLLDPLTNESAAPVLIDRLKNEEDVKQSKLEPLSTLLTIKQYEQGKVDKTKHKWMVNVMVTEALYIAFYASFKNITPTNKRYLLAVDLSKSMTHGGVNGSPQLRPLIATAAMSMLIARTEQQCQLVGFSQTIAPVRLSPQMPLQEVCTAISEVPMGGTDCGLPVLWACENQKPVDVFIVFTDTDTWAGQVHPKDALQRYRKELNIPHARLAVCALTSKNFHLADPDDAGMIDLVGFEESTPKILRNFAMGDL